MENIDKFDPAPYAVAILAAVVIYLGIDYYARHKSEELAKRKIEMTREIDSKPYDSLNYKPR